MFNFKKATPLVISEPDIQAALSHLRSLPHRPNMPVEWDRHRLIGLIREAIHPETTAGDWFQVAPGIYALIVHFGANMTNIPVTERRLQVWLTIRSVGTDLEKVTEIAMGKI